MGPRHTPLVDLRCHQPREVASVRFSFYQALWKALDMESEYGVRHYCGSNLTTFDDDECDDISEAFLEHQANDFLFKSPTAEKCTIIRLPHSIHSPAWVFSSSKEAMSTPIYARREGVKPLPALRTARKIYGMPSTSDEIVTTIFVSNLHCSR